MNVPHPLLQLFPKQSPRQGRTSEHQAQWSSQVNAVVRPSVSKTRMCSWMTLSLFAPETYRYSSRGLRKVYIALVREWYSEPGPLTVWPNGLVVAGAGLAVLRAIDAGLLRRSAVLPDNTALLPWRFVAGHFGACRGVWNRTVGEGVSGEPCGFKLDRLDCDRAGALNAWRGRGIRVRL